MKILINGNQAVGDGPGITFDTDRLESLTPPRAGRPGKLANMPDLLWRIRQRIERRPSLWACHVPDQIYIDHHWYWTGSFRSGSPITTFSGRQHHVALAIWSLWQGYPIVMKGPIRRLCLEQGCVNAHHYYFPYEPRPEPMTFSVTGDPGRELEESFAGISPANDGPVLIPTDADYLRWWLSLSESDREQIRENEPENYERFEALRK